MDERVKFVGPDGYEFFEAMMHGGCVRFDIINAPYEGGQWDFSPNDARKLRDWLNANVHG
jgi:hypothetical protein